IFIVACFIGVKLVSSNAKSKWQWDAFKFQIPVFNTVLREFNLARISRAMSVLLKSGMPMDQALEFAATLTNNSHYQKSVLATIPIIRKGIPLTEVLHGYPKLYPPIASRMIEIGERTGQVDKMFDKLATFYEKSVSQTLANLSTIIEPFLLLTMGAIVGLIGLAILTPI